MGNTKTDLTNAIDEYVFVYDIGQVCFGMAHVFILLSKKLANDACLWDNAVTKGERK